MNQNLQKIADFLQQNDQLSDEEKTLLAKAVKDTESEMAITAYGDQENYNSAMQLGADDFLTKPVDFAALKEKLKAMSGTL